MPAGSVTIQESIDRIKRSLRFWSSDATDKGALMPMMALGTPSGTPLNLDPPECLSHYVLTADTSFAGNTLAALLGGTVLVDQVAAGLSAITVTVTGFPIRVRFDGGDPSTIGHIYGVDNVQPYVWDAADFADIAFVGIGGAATVNIALWA
jgi:hypothetical protein